MIDEQWKLVFGGNYEISSHGRFRRATAGRKTHAGNILKTTKLKIGYIIVQPVINGKNVQHYVHKLVAENFIGPCPDGHEINHKDGSKSNANVENLEYVTHGDNMRHAFRSGLVSCKRSHGDEVILKIKTLRESGLSYSTIAKQTGVSIGYCWMVANGKARA